MIYLAPSILSADFAVLGADVADSERGGADLIHVDVMDGHFVPNISIGVPVVKSLKKATRLPLDVHLMIENPGRYIAPFADAGADILTVHYEACEGHVGEVLEQISARGVRPSLSIKPATPVAAIEPYLDGLSMVLVMTVEPGFGGQSMIPETLDKVSELRRIITQKGYPCALEVDGGVTIDNVHRFLAAGASIIVAGSAVYHPGETEQRARRFKEAFAEYEKTQG